MGIDRKAISDAILALVRPDDSYYKNQLPKKFRFIDEVTPAELPALYLTWDGDSIKQSEDFAGEKATEDFMLHIYEDGGNDPRRPCR
jgi:hypothetical protein